VAVGSCTARRKSTDSDGQISSLGCFGRI
jgi:hypothetical protein